MTDEHSKFEETAVIRSHYNEAINEACNIYYESEEIAAYLVLEIFRLENLKSTSGSEENERLERISEKMEVSITNKRDNALYTGQTASTGT